MMGRTRSTAWLEHDFAPGQYYLFVDGYGTSSGSYELDIDVLCTTGSSTIRRTVGAVDDPVRSEPVHKDLTPVVTSIFLRGQPARASQGGSMLHSPAHVSLTPPTWVRRVPTL